MLQVEPVMDLMGIPYQNEQKQTRYGDRERERRKNREGLKKHGIKWWTKCVT